MGYYDYNQPNYGGFQQPQMPMQRQQPQGGYPLRDVRFVTAEEARAFIVMPNSSALLIDMAGGTAYFKTADMYGQSVTKSYKFTEIDPSALVSKAIEEKPTVNFDEFVKRQDISDYIQKFGFVTKEQFKALQLQLEDLKRTIVNNNDGGVVGNGREQQQ